MIKILAVDDEMPILNLIKLSLTNAGYFCDIAETAAIAIDKFHSSDYDLILLDIMLPEVNGFELFEYIKEYNIPVIFLTAKASISDRVKGLHLGAEDYVVKPFAIAELIARVEVVCRRFNKISDVYNINGLIVDSKSMIVKRDNELIKLTPIEFDLLLLFCKTPNTALYRDFIYEKVWGGELEFETKTVDLHVQRLRKKAGLQRELQTVSKVGYRLVI